jgi:hypothetical protein
LAVARLSRLELVVLVRDHVETFRSFRSGKWRVWRLIFEFVVPAAAAVALVTFGHTVGPIATSLMTVLAILAGLLFNLLLLIFDAGSRRRQEHAGSQRDERVIELLRQTHANASFAILLAILATLGALLARLVEETGRIQNGVSGMVFYLTGVFVLTLFTILKRVRVLVQEELRARPVKTDERAAS